MITDNETNFLYFSSLIKENKKYLPFWNRLSAILIENKIPFDFIENTRDIWCRDYMPIQKNTNEFVQFEYFPDYLIDPKFIARLTIPSETKIINDKIDKQNSKLRIDGGNIVKSNSSAILTEKIITENSDLEPKTIITKLKKDLRIENIYLIPKQPGDILGHSDGMVRFIDEKNLLVSDYRNESDSWKKKMDNALRSTGFNIKTLPSEPIKEKNADGDFTAKGIYINFAQIGNIILFPQFGLSKDKAALETVMELYPDCKIIPIDSNEIAVDGGVLNCITWNIKSVTKMNFNKLSKKAPSQIEQEKFVYEKLDFYLSTYDYHFIATGFENAWNNNTGNPIGDGDLKNMTYQFLEKVNKKNHIPQNIVDKTIYLILDYLESIGQYGFDASEN